MIQDSVNVLLIKICLYRFESCLKSCARNGIKKKIPFHTEPK